MNTCAIHDSGTIELYFYDELQGLERHRIELHLRSCRICASALAELRVISDALSTRPDVASPPSGDWSAFMARLDASIAATESATVVQFPRKRVATRQAWTGWLTMAALVALVATSIFIASQAGRGVVESTAPLQPATIVGADTVAGDVVPVSAGLKSVGLRHLERSKLVVLGLAAKEAEGTPDAADWAYERELASALLADTKLYRLAAEARGLQSLAGVMKDLELVLLQASMAQETDTAALPQIQRLIRKRGLVEKMDVVGTTGLLP